MKRSSSFIKRRLALVLVLLLSIESFAAVVGDNDGAAFITKAEFDSMKNDFQSQLDRYNSSLDNKIDGAIASYLAGVSVGRKIEINPLVNNYSDMKWKRKWEVYGDTTKWVNNTSNGVKTSCTWFTPHTQTFTCIRNKTGFQLSLIHQRVAPGTVFGITGDFDTAYGRWCAPAGQNGIPVFTIACDGTTDKEIILKDWEGDFTDTYEYVRDGNRLFISRKTELGRVHAPLANEVTEEVLNGTTGTWALSGWTDLYNYPHAPLLDKTMFTPVEELPTASNSIIHWRVYSRFNYGGTIRYARGEFDLHSTEMEPYQHWADESNAISYFAGPTDAVIKHPNSLWSNTFWNEPYFYDLVERASVTQQETDLKLLMLGKDFDWDAPLFRYDTTQRRMGRLAFKTKFANYDDMQLNVTSIRISSGSPWTYDAHTSVTYPDPIPVKWRSPLIETYPLKKITSGLFKYKNANLQIGSGIPLVESAAANGNLTVEFDYDIGRTRGDLPSTLSGIDVDLRSADYLSSSGAYYKGLLGDSTSVTTFHNLQVNNTSKHVKIVIEGIKKDSDVWLRIAPHDTDGGLYAKMSNLKVSLLSQ